MTDLEKLWDYQTADVAVDRLQNEMKRSPTRIKLLKCRENLEEQQKNYKRIEGEIAVMADRLEALKDALTRTENNLKALQAKIEANPATTSEEASAYIADVRKLRDNILNYEKEINKIRKAVSGSMLFLRRPSPNSSRTSDPRSRSAIFFFP